MHQSDQMVKICYEVLSEKKGQDITILDIAEISSLADYFVIANGDNKRQVQALCDHVEEALGRAGYVLKSKEGYEGCSWILLDYGDIIIHIFDRESRRFYDLDRIWRDAKVVDMEKNN